MLGKLLKAGVAMALTPAAVVADVLRLPVSAYNDQHPFPATSTPLKSAGQNVADAVKPKGDA